MNNVKEFTVQNYYLVEIDHVGGVDPRNKVTKWSWDVYIATNEKEEYRGKALAPGRGVEVPWTVLGKKDLLEEMIEMCQQHMPKHP
ncbi:hypothetical protein [Halalkalibacter nanhaiisediminis]|uniref:Uncharacterized protein n=1 Tax=Halalkalibacter nanhaiisediminis TaxID=688079 RepID=A0A562QEV8_9BACI|nr:hypothetical protein [Halalkalibacter nanhaiisediminis]TWI55271.1 hypothetical protein IQ10_02818 [Halalkalibacter nanhaiisediminis]